MLRLRLLSSACSVWKDAMQYSLDTLIRPEVGVTGDGMLQAQTHTSGTGRPLSGLWAT